MPCGKGMATTTRHRDITPDSVAGASNSNSWNGSRAMFYDWQSNDDIDPRINIFWGIKSNGEVGDGDTNIEYETITDSRPGDD